MTDEEELAELRKQYPYATLQTHMLVDGVIKRRCGICLVKPLPDVVGSVMWCNPCIDEYLESTEDMESFISRKRAESGRQSRPGAI